MTWAVFPLETHYNAVAEILSTGSERVVAIVGCALLDEAVTRTLRERFRDDSEVAANILDVERPLGNLGSKIDVLYLLEAFDKTAREALKGLAGIRNFFAHNLNASFNSQDRMFLKAINRLKLHDGRKYYPYHLYGPDSKYAIEPTTDEKTIFIVNLKLGLLTLMRDRLSHKTYTNQPLSEEQLHDRYGSRRESEEQREP